MLLLAGCSAKRGITSKRTALEPKIAALREARKSAAAFKPDPTAKSDAPAVLSQDAPDDVSDTVVIIDEDIASFGQEVDCTALARTGKGVDCRASRFGGGGGCAIEVASVLERNRFRDEDGYHPNYGERCARWLERAKYALVIHFDSQSYRGATAWTYAKGNAVLVELASKKPLGRVTFDVESKEETGGAAPSSSGMVYVTKDASPVDTLVRKALGEQLAKTFPSARVDRWAN